MPAWLAFDTSTDTVHCGLAAAGRAWTRQAAGGAQASALLIPELLRLLADAGLALRDLDAIAFGRGPGAFTGLRTACSVAQGLAFGAALPVLPLDTLKAVAEDAAAQAPGGLDDVWAATDARMGEVYAAHYRRTPAGWQALAAPALYSLDALHAAWRTAPPAAVAGSALAAFGERLDSGAARRFPDAAPRAVALLALAAAAWAAGEAVDAAEALPHYLRDKVAQTTAERDAARAGGLRRAA